MSRRKTRKSQNWQDTNVVNMSEALSTNARAMHEGPKRKTWSLHDLKSIKALRPRQEDMMHAFFEGRNICAHGSAGTGKTFLATYLALTELLRRDGKFEKIIIVRSAVQTREVGHLPGDINEKVAVYELPYIDIFADLLGRASSYNDMKDAGIVEFNVSSFIRGLTWDNTIVIIDEAQNMTWHELDGIITRLGSNSRILVCGDAKHQQDLTKREQSGFGAAMKVMDNMSCFESVEFTHEDIVRSAFVREWITTRDELNL